MRGENVRQLPLAWSAPGTPPHAWGKLLTSIVASIRFDGTPPHAWGKHTVSLFYLSF